MAKLNITYRGLSADVPVPLDYNASDMDIKRIAVELIRSGEIPGLQVKNLDRYAFSHYVVDRFAAPDGDLRLFLRPKVPFGS